MKHLCQIFNDNLYVSVFAPIDSRMYVLIHNNNALMVDPCIDNEMMVYLKESGVDKLTIIPTHEHYDHISGVNWLKKAFDCTVICNRSCAENMNNPKKNFSAMFEAMFLNNPEKLRQVKLLSVKGYSCTADVTFEDSYKMDWHDHTIHIISVPGHSNGSQCVLLDDDWIFTGDSLLRDNPVITRLPGGCKKDYENITQPILNKVCKGRTVFPGHGAEFKVEE